MSETIVPPNPPTNPTSKIKLPKPPPTPKPEDNTKAASIPDVYPMLSISVTMRATGPTLDARRFTPNGNTEYYQYKGTNKKATNQELLGYLSKMLVNAKWQSQPYA